MSVKSLYNKHKEVVNYLIFGALTTLVSLGVYYACTHTFLDPTDPGQLQAANVISWIISVTFAYVVNRKYVFNSKNKNVLAEAAGFFGARLVTLGIDMGVMFLFVSVMHMDDRLAKILVQVIIIVSNYVISKFLIFRKKQ